MIQEATLSRSSSKAEYCAFASTTREIQWLSYLFRDLHIIPQATTVLFCVNKSALHLAVNLCFMSVANILKSIAMWLEKRFVMVFFVCSLSILSHRLLTSVQNLSYPNCSYIYCVYDGFN